MDIETHLLIIADKESSPKEANESITKLYEEFRGFVYNLAFKHIGFILQKEELALNVMTEVFLKIWNSPLDWEFNSNKHGTQEDGYKAYLATIAHYKLLEELRKNKPVRENETTIIDDAESEWKWALLDEDFDTLDKELIKRHNLIDSCLAELPERKSDIVRMYFFLYEDDRRMTSEKIRLMEETFETTWQNIRQIISRTKKTIEDLVKKKL
ncbi:MAG: RNA polymerase sigma factor [Allomuricauda sp.]|uniref:Sigma-70 family RNA polymerase sigma factor n=1 Tax=Flagellimonas oceani TaxID=2698672 RepID=A0A6G7J7M2_9FLAO|nr:MULTISPECIES: sigma-70 family RNA polymerase sigma factor [Allomuricauda]MBW8241903.1 sigma-70 family RNA polymerase sigma factor [Allomuricauda oceani]QII46816.1 sigma-70 family RNA polymerase sigma factor [Allomuricauda oceani]